MAAKRNSTPIPQDGKCIRYDKDSGDYACYLSGELIGYAPNYSDAETLCDRTYREQLEAGLFATATQLDGSSSVEAIAADYASAPAAEPLPAVDVETWQDETGAYTDFGAGSELTRAVIGSYNGDKPGVELIIGGTCINQYLEQVLTLADVQTLRDNLTALLSDARLVAAERAANRAAAARMVDACFA